MLIAATAEAGVIYFLFRDRFKDYFGPDGMLCRS